jgi:CrcB protein
MFLAVGRLVGYAFPWGTLLINVLGSFVIGWYGTLTLPGGPWPAGGDMRLFVMVGICGGFTTFSVFSLQTFELLRGGEEVRALAYIAASVLLCLAGTVFGHHIAAGMTARP